MSQGKRYNKGKLRWRNVPMFIFEDIIRVGQFGEEKYDTFNFMKGLPILDTMDSLKRHLTAFENPYVADEDEESGVNHLAHVAWNAVVALHHLKHNPDLDDRYKVDNLFDDYKLSELTKEEKELIKYDDLEHEFKYEKLDQVKVGALIAEVVERMYDENFTPKYILRTQDGQIFSEKEGLIEMAPVKLEE